MREKPARDRPIDAADISVIGSDALAPLFWPPLRTELPSAWAAHIPFAHWIVIACRPNVLVELGTQNGASYAAFCQAVVNGRLDTRCYAIGTWRGDKNAGEHGDGSYENLRAFNADRFEGFSELLRMSFDEALPCFADGTVDILHIDGLQTYEAARNAFETWLPKMSPRGVVLFHHTNVREGTLGVWRLFEELRGRSPSFEFPHGNGLGVLAVGQDAPQPVVGLCGSSGAEVATVRQRFAFFGSRSREAFAASAGLVEAESRGNMIHLMAKAGWTESAILQDQLGVARRERDEARNRPRLPFLGRPHGKPKPPAYEDPDYGRWIAEHDTLSPYERLAIRHHIASLPLCPLISVVMPVYDPPLDFLKQAVASVQAQLYPSWELCIADDASPSKDVRKVLRELAELEPRLKIVERETNGHISAATNSALDVATGGFVAFMDQDDVLAERALYEVVAELNRHPDADLIYSDEDNLDGNGWRCDPYFKTSFNRELMLGQNAITHLGVYRRSLVEKLGGMRLGFEGSQDYDLALRVVDASSPARIRHIPSILYHWRRNSGNSSFSVVQTQKCLETARSAIAEHLQRRGEKAEIFLDPRSDAWFALRREPPDPPRLVTIVLSVGDDADRLSSSLERLIGVTEYPDLEIIVVGQASSSTTQSVAGASRPRCRVRMLAESETSDTSALKNAAASGATGSILVFLDSDLAPADRRWLSDMVAAASLADVGCVGPRLIDANGHGQHGGVVLGMGDVASVPRDLSRHDDVGYFGRAILASETSAVAGACLVVRKAVFDEIGGFDEIALPTRFADVDLCLSARRLGYRNIYAPVVELVRQGAARPGLAARNDASGTQDPQKRHISEKWGPLLSDDPFYNPNLSLDPEGFSLAFPPRREKPWADFM